MFDIHLPKFWEGSKKHSPFYLHDPQWPKPLPKPLLNISNFRWGRLSHALCLSGGESRGIDHSHSIYLIVVVWFNLNKVSECLFCLLHISDQLWLYNWLAASWLDMLWPPVLTAAEIFYNWFWANAQRRDLIFGSQYINTTFNCFFGFIVLQIFIYPLFSCSSSSEPSDFPMKALFKSSFSSSDVVWLRRLLSLELNLMPSS